MATKNYDKWKAMTIQEAADTLTRKATLLRGELQGR